MDFFKFIRRKLGCNKVVVWDCFVSLLNTSKAERRQIDMTKKVEVKPHYIDICGNQDRKCCVNNPNCYKEIRVINGKPFETGQCCNYY